MAQKYSRACRRGRKQYGLSRFDHALELDLGRCAVSMRAGSMACCREIDTRGSGLRGWQLTRSALIIPAPAAVRLVCSPSRFHAVDRPSRAKSSDT